jgi:hypothetical protein
VTSEVTVVSDKIASNFGAGSIKFSGNVRSVREERRKEMYEVKGNTKMFSEFVTTRSESHDNHVATRNKFRNVAVNL